MGSAALDFQNVLSWASSGVIRSFYISLRTQSTHLPLGLFLALSCQQLLSLYCLLLCMCPYQHSLISLTFSLMLFTPNSFLMPTLFTLSLSVTPLILLNNLISVFSRICSSSFPTVQHSVPYLCQCALLEFSKTQMRYSSKIYDYTSNNFYSHQRFSHHRRPSSGTELSLFSDNSVPEEGWQWWLKRWYE